MNPFRNRPTPTRAPATGWASAAPWAAYREITTDPASDQSDPGLPSPTHDTEEGCHAASWAY